MPVFTVLHVCVGNICRSPMAERLLVKALREHVGDRVDELYRSHGAGTGTWHVGEAMNSPAATEVRRRGGDPSGFLARHLVTDLIDESDLVLCATREQVARVVNLRPAARARTFVLGELGRLLPLATRDASGRVAWTEERRERSDQSDEGRPRIGRPEARASGVSTSTGATAHARGVALVAAMEAVRSGAPSRAGDDLDDPWGMGQKEFARVADEIEATVVPLATALAR